MSIQWTCIAGYLYFEIAIVALLVFPVASPKRWNRLFKSRLFSMFRHYASVYFSVVLSILALFLMDAIREMRKYSHASEGGQVHVAAEMKNSVKLFRSQRNFYITGFAIFLAFVIRRLVVMIIIQAELVEKSQNIIRVAENTSEIAKKISTDDEKELATLMKQADVLQLKLNECVKENQELKEEAKLWKKKYEELQEVDN